MELYGAARNRYWEDKATDVGVVHPDKPRDALRRLTRLARQAWGIGKKPFWADPQKMRRFVQRLSGVRVRDRAEGAKRKEAEPNDGGG